MTHTLDQPSTRTITISQPHAESLVRLLDCFSTKHGLQDELEGLFQHVSDAFWLAGWLREDVNLTLKSQELIDLLKAIVIMLNEYDWTDSDGEALEAICKELSSAAFAPGQVATTIHGPVTRFDELELQFTEIAPCS